MTVLCIDGDSAPSNAIVLNHFCSLQFTLFGHIYIHNCSYMSIQVRLSAFDLVKSFTEEEDLPGPCYAAIIVAINKHLEEATPNSSPHWWKVSYPLAVPP